MNKVEIAEAERKHHPFSPSTLQAREACPKYQPRGGTNIAAERGTLQHKAAELGLDDNALSDEEAAASAECLDFLESRRKVLVAARLLALEEMTPEDRAMITYSEVEELSEVYLPVDDQKIVFRGGSDPTTTAGYIDRALIAHDRLNAEIFDWKFGKWEVEQAENNLQGIAYFLGLLYRIPTLQTVRVWFKQPHIDRIDFADFYAKDKARHMLRVLTVVWRSISAADKPEDFSMANPSATGCMFCGLIGRCDKVAAIALNVGHKFAPLKIPADITPSRLREPKQAKCAMQCASVLGVWCAAIKTTTSNACISGAMELPEDYTIATRSDRVITDAAKFRQIAELFLTPAEYDALREQLPPITKVEKSISDKAVRGTKTARIEEFNDKLKEAKALDREPPITFLKMASSSKGKTTETN